MEKEEKEKLQKSAAKENGPIVSYAREGRKKGAIRVCLKLSSNGRKKQENAREKSSRVRS